MTGSSGYSMIELVIVLVIGATLFLGIAEILPIAWRVGSGEASSESARLQGARDAVVGFALEQHRLPCPDTDNNGTENCSGVERFGGVPARTLGIEPIPDARYGVYRRARANAVDDADLAAFRPRSAPIPLDGNLLTGASYNNGLDFCRGLVNAMRGIPALTVGGQASGVPVAFALSRPGSDGLFAGGNVGTQFPLPGRATAAPDDDVTVAMGLSELASGLGCNRRLAQTGGTLRAFDAGFDLQRVAALNADYRAFALQSRKANQVLSAASVTLATAGVGKAIGGLALAISNAAITKGVSAALAIPVSVAGLAEAAANLTDASLSLADAKEAVIVAGRQNVSAVEYRTQVRDARAAARRVMVENERAGLLP